MTGNGDSTGGDTCHCPHCGEAYYEPEDWPVDPDYMYHGHILWECQDPDLREKAWLNASPKERHEVWPDA